MSERDHQTLGFYERRGDLELGRGNVISTGDLATFPGSYPVYSSSAVGEGVFGRYGQHMFDEELITWSIDGGGRPFHRRKHRFSVTNVCGFLRVKRPDRWDYGYLHAVLEGLQSGIQFDYQMKAHPSVIRELYRFDCIPIEEQRRISSIRDTLDTTIRQTEAIIAKLKQVKQGLLHDLLTRGIDANGELRPPQSEAPHLYKASPLGWIPCEWAASSLDSACADVVDCPHSTPAFSNEGVLVARTMHIKDGRFLEHIASRVSEAEYAKRIQRLAPKPGDVVFTREAPVGEAFVIPDGMRICLGQRVMLLRPSPDKLLGSFLTAQIYSGVVADRISALTAGTTNPHLNVSEVRQFILPLPPFSEQVEIDARLNGLERRIRAEASELEKLAVLKSGLMDDLLTGRVRVTPLLTQPTTT